LGEKSKVNFNKLDKSRLIPFEHEVRVTKMKHIVEILSLSKEPDALLKIKKLNKFQYMNLDTGEVFDYQLSENRGQNIAGLKKTFKTIRNLINNNFTGAANELFITLSYAENMKDVKQLYKDFDVFMKRFRRKFSDIDYLSIVEPQGRGAWHCHVLARFNSLETIFIKNNEVIAPMWGHGFTKTKSLKDVDNIGAYLNAYLSDVEVNDENSEVIFGAMVSSQRNVIELEDGSIHDLNKGNYVDLKIIEKDVIGEDGEKTKKKFVKGARLHMYPSGMNLYRCSRGIKKPETEKMRYFEAKKIVGSEPANYSRTIELDKDGQFLNSITYEQYNLKRTKKQSKLEQTCTKE